MSSVAKSSISSPRLTSTTNARVADAENVCYSDVFLPGYSTDDVVDQEVLKHKQGARIKGQENEDLQKKTHPKSSPWASTVRSVRKKLSHTRRASTSLLLEAPWPRRAGESKKHSATPFAVPSREASSLSLNKDKTNQRSGKEHRPGNGPGVEEASYSISARPSQAAQSIDLPTPYPRDAPRLPRLYSGSTTDLFLGSLSRSFASAVEKLDSQASSTADSETSIAPRLKSARSYFSLHKVRRENSIPADMSRENERRGVPSLEVSDRRARTNQKQLDMLTAISQSMNKQAQKPSIASSKPAPLKFSGKKNRYVLAKPEPRSPDGVNPLKMHPEVTTFARPPSQTGISVTPGHGSSSKRTDDDDGSESIERAIIYSPSTGNLSEYSRGTSSPSLTDAQMRKARAPQETPTRKPLHKRSGSVLKRSVSTFFGKSASVMRLGNLTPSKRSKRERERTVSARHTSWPESHRPAHREISVPKIRERAMSTPDLYGPDGLRAVWDYQPSTPSPLRKATKFSSTVGGRQRAVTTTTPVRVPVEGLVLSGPRSATVCANPEKRYGRLIAPNPTELTVC